jgi:hypothetical protein
MIGHGAAVDLAADATAAALFVTRHIAAGAVAQAVQLLLTAVARIFVAVAVALIALGDAASAFITRCVGMSQARAAGVAGSAVLVAAEMSFTTLPIFVAVCVARLARGNLTVTLRAARLGVLDAARPLALHTVFEVIRRGLTAVSNLLVTVSITIRATREQARALAAHCLGVRQYAAASSSLVDDAITVVVLAIAGFETTFTSSSVELLTTRAHAALCVRKPRMHGFAVVDVARREKEQREHATHHTGPSVQGSAHATNSPAAHPR